MKQPRVSIVMPAYNVEHYIKEAIESILQQTFSDFELIIVNDGSTDKTADIIQGFLDPRIIVIDQENKGLVASLNRAIDTARADLIARHDADDCSLPERLAMQVSFLDSHTDVIIVGSSMGVMDMASTYLHDHFVLLHDSELKQELLIRSPFAHGSVVFKKDAFIKAGRYDTTDWPAEDYGLWVRLSQFGSFANLDTPLYIYRENMQGISQSNLASQISKTHIIRERAWQNVDALIPKNINTELYIDKPMGQFRIERITYNLLNIVRVSLFSLKPLIALKIIKLLVSNRLLARKCARLVLIKLRVKNA